MCLHGARPFSTFVRALAARGRTIARRLHRVRDTATPCKRDRAQTLLPQSSYTELSHSVNGLPLPARRFETQMTVTHR